MNNGLGVIGFVQTASKADDAFHARMEREAALAAKVCLTVFMYFMYCMYDTWIIFLDIQLLCKYEYMYVCMYG